MLTAITTSSCATSRIFSATPPRPSTSPGRPSQSSVINLISGQKYQKVGGELSTSTLSSLKVSASTFKVLLNGSAVSFRGYLINDNNYYSIADIADAIGFEAGWDNATRTVRLTTPDPDPEQPDNNNSQQQ